jgi:transcription elongation GreA/GreB family factor
VSKAFTKEDDAGGFTAPPASRGNIPVGPFRLTATGARLAAAHPDAAVREAAAAAEVLAPVLRPERAVLGATLIVRVARGEAAVMRRYRLVTSEERTLLDDGCSIDGPLGRVLLGAQPGDVREVALPRGAEELEVVQLDGEPDR